MEAFIEKQNFLKRWWGVSLPIVVASLVPLISIDKNTPVLVGIATPVIVTAFVFLLFRLLTLYTRIDEKCIAVRFAPFHRKDRVIEWHSLKSARVVKYDPLFEYGGWGFRKGWTGSKIAYNVSGKTGLELELNDGRKIMIGTAKKEELLSYLSYLKNKYAITAIGEKE
ncbi:MAG: hypothetical protein V4658_14780 [Bacteroidota bacterium]